MRILLSALACSPKLGSEALVGYHVVEALSGRFDADVITSTAMQAPSRVKTHSIAVQFDDPNDVGAAQLLRFELRQLPAVRRLLRSEPFEIVHRVTPSGSKAALFRVPSVPLVLGPMLGSDPPPESFQAIFKPRLPRSFSLRSLGGRVGHGIARRVFERFSTWNQLLENAAVILVGTKVTQRRLPARLHSRCRLLTYAGVEHDRFTPPVMDRPARIPQLLFVGRLVPYKGPELLLRAAAAARQRCRFELKIVGSGDPSYERYCRQLTAQLQLIDSVTFVNRLSRDALVDVYRTADIFCMPSIETYGLAILEAMSSGCAPLVADLNGPGEIVQPGIGLKVPLETPEKFIEEYAERIVQLVEDAKLRGALGESAREHVIRFHDWKRIQSSLLDVYEEIFSAKRTAAEFAACRGGSP